MAISIKDILFNGTLSQQKALFLFNADHSDEKVLLKFNLWARHFFSKYFSSPDAKFHKEIDENNLKVYSSDLDSFIDIAFRGAAKTARTKLFLAFCIANDEDHYRRYMKVLCADTNNSNQIVTDIYNMLVSPRVTQMYPEIFQKSEKKREETMRSFTTATGVKMIADTVGTGQRGAIQEEARPDFIWCHKKGTQILDQGKWMKVEEHESFNGFRKENGLKVTLQTLPTNEIVTKEHRYWVKNINIIKKKGDGAKDLGDGWIEAQNLKKGSYIGYRIERKIIRFPKLEKYIPGKSILRDRKGKISSTLGGFNFIDIDLFNDKEWWWFFGLFWGDGNLSTKKSKGSNSAVVCVTIADKDSHIFERVDRLLKKYNIKYSIIPNVGCFRLQFSHAVLARWLRNWYIGGNSQKVPSSWVEFIDTEFQRELILGYIDADGSVDRNGNCVRIASVCLPGLLMVRRILARLDVASSIRNTSEAKDEYIICGNKCKTQKKYDLRFRENASSLGFPISNQTRYSYPETFIKDGFLWSKVKEIKKTEEELFCPIQTKSHDYLTDFGLSHNCEDFEDRTTLRSAKKTKAIWDNMEEARTGLAKEGACLYTCNYISEAGNVHRLVGKPSETRKVLTVPILKHGLSAWPDRYSLEEIAQMKRDDDDFEGERMCQPSASKDILFDRDTLDKMEEREPIRTLAGFKIFREFNPSHRYGSGHDVSGGVGLDSSTSVFIDFECVPAQVVATFASNTIKPEAFGHEILRETQMYDMNIAGIENNYGTAAIAIARQLGVKLYKTQAKETKIGEFTPTEYGWHTNAITKPKMLFALTKAIEDGILVLNDRDLIREMKSYSRNDLIEEVRDPRLTTRHFDLLIACAIAWQMKDFAESKKSKTSNDQELQRMIQENRNKSSIIR